MSEEKRNVKKRTLTQDQRLNKVQSVPASTKRAMRCCHLFAKILKQHFDDGICELMDENSYDYKHYTSSILTNLLLVGDIPRDILLGSAVHDIDITFNLRELTKIHLQHLTKYHSQIEYQKKEIDCVYFQHYLNKFEEHSKAQNDDEKAQLDMIKFHNNSHIFNARYFIDILESSYLLQYQLSINDQPTLGCVSCAVTGDVKHEGEDLNGAKFTFTDTFDENVVLSVQKQKQIELREREMLVEYGYDPDHLQSDKDADEARKRTRWKSITLAPKGMDYTLEFDAEFKPIEIEIYDTRILDKLLTYDFSVNTAIIPLQSIADYFDEDDSNYQGSNMAIWFWEYIIENGIGECDAIHDITIDRVIRVPQPNREKYIINIHGGMYHFWRTVEFMIRLPNFYIDDKLIDAHIALYDGWLNMEYFGDDTKRVEFINKFVHLVVNYCYSTADLRQMLNVLEILEFNDKFCELLEKHDKFRRELMAAIKARDYEELTIIIFISYGYPFKFKSEMEEEVRRLKIQNQGLNAKVVELQEDVSALEKSKVNLAVNCTKVIDEFRSYFTHN